jgi:hypothetical protein
MHRQQPPAQERHARVLLHRLRHLLPCRQQRAQRGVQRVHHVGRVARGRQRGPRRSTFCADLLQQADHAPQHLPRLLHGTSAAQRGASGVRARRRAALQGATRPAQGSSSLPTGSRRYARRTCVMRFSFCSRAPTSGRGPPGGGCGGRASGGCPAAAPLLPAPPTAPCCNGSTANMRDCWPGGGWPAGMLAPGLADSPIMLRVGKPPPACCCGRGPGGCPPSCCGASHLLLTGSGRSHCDMPCPACLPALLSGPACMRPAPPPTGGCGGAAAGGGSPPAAGGSSPPAAAAAPAASAWCCSAGGACGSLRTPGGRPGGCCCTCC